MEPIRECNTCKAIKPLSEGFGRHEGGRLGRRAKCKKCYSAVYRGTYVRKPQKARLTVEEKIQRRRASDRRYYRQPETRKKIKARNKLTLEVWLGNVEKEPCLVCGIKENIEAHHEDYSKPLDVIWLCRKHHWMYHKDKLTILLKNFL